jgi:hypothetical protein
VGPGASDVAVLSALAHGNGPEGLLVVKAALAALRRFDKKVGDVYLHLIIYGALRDPIKKALEALIMQQFQGIEFELPPFAQKLITRGELKSGREAVRKVAARSGLVLSPEHRARIDACEDLDMLDRWFERAFTARTADELFD